MKKLITSLGPHTPPTTHKLLPTIAGLLIPCSKFFSFFQDSYSAFTACPDSLSPFDYNFSTLLLFTNYINKIIELKTVDTITILFHQFGNVNQIITRTHWKPEWRKIQCIVFPPWGMVFRKCIATLKKTAWCLQEFYPTAAAAA